MLIRHWHIVECNKIHALDQLKSHPIEMKTNTVECPRNLQQWRRQPSTTMTAQRLDGDENSTSSNKNTRTLQRNARGSVGQFILTVAFQMFVPQRQQNTPPSSSECVPHHIQKTTTDDQTTHGEIRKTRRSHMEGPKQ